MTTTGTPFVLLYCGCCLYDCMLVLFIIIILLRYVDDDDNEGYEIRSIILLFLSF